MVEDNDHIPGESAVGPDDGLGRWQSRSLGPALHFITDITRHVDRSFPCGYP